MSEAIVCCACDGVPLASQAAYRVITKRKAPISWAGENRISVLLELLPPNSPVYQHVLALSKKSGKFSYFIEWDMDGNITRMYNLLNGKEVK